MGRFPLVTCGDETLGLVCKDTLEGQSPTYFGGAGQADRRENAFSRSTPLGGEEIKKLWRGVAEASGSKCEMQGRSCKGKRGSYLGWIDEWERAIRRPGNTPIRELMSDRRFTEAVLIFLRSTKVGRIKEVVLSSGRPSGRP